MYLLYKEHGLSNLMLVSGSTVVYTEVENTSGLYVTVSWKRVPNSFLLRCNNSNLDNLMPAVLLLEDVKYDHHQQTTRAQSSSICNLPLITLPFPEAV
jgi:hypothetical protein